MPSDGPAVDTRIDCSFIPLDVTSDQSVALAADQSTLHTRRSVPSNEAAQPPAAASHRETRPS